MNRRRKTGRAYSTRGLVIHGQACQAILESRRSFDLGLDPELFARYSTVTSTFRLASSSCQGVRSRLLNTPADPSFLQPGPVDRIAIEVVPNLKLRRVIGIQRGHIHLQRIAGVLQHTSKLANAQRRCRTGNIVWDLTERTSA